jgi:hypothetical protein
LVWPSPPGNRRRGRRPGPTFRLPTWANFSPKRQRAILGTTKPARCGASHRTLVHSPPPSLVSTQASEVAGAPTDRRSGAVACLLTGRRRSPEGEPAIVKQTHCDALSWEPEPVNLRVGVGEPRVPFPDSDDVGSGDGRPRYVPGSKS